MTNLLNAWMAGATQREIALREGLSQATAHRRIRAEAHDLGRSMAELKQERGEGRGSAWGRKLRMGTQIMDAHHHHRGMRWLKAHLGDPRPASNLQLSLVNPDSPRAYWGFTWVNEEQRPYRLSTDPDDYVWETSQENHDRGHPARDLNRQGPSIEEEVHNDH
jgi:hypothetical protein